MDRNRGLSAAAELAATRREGAWQRHSCRLLGGSVPPVPEVFLRHEPAPMEGARSPAESGGPVRNRPKRPSVISAIHSWHGCPSAEPCVRFGCPTSILLLGPSGLACLPHCEMLPRRPPRRPPSRTFKDC